MNAITHQETQEIALNNPLDRLFAQYRLNLEGIQRIAGFVADASQMYYFFEAARVNSNSFHAGAAQVFVLEPAIKALDAEYWQKAMMLTDVLEYMPAGKRNEWTEQIQKHKTPPFEIDSVKQTLIQLLNNRAQFMAERVDGLFRALSHEHLTNTPQAFGKRFIMGYMLSYGSINYQRANYIHDLRCVIGKFMGRDVPNSHGTHTDLNNVAHDGQWNEFDGGAFKIRLYKKGTAHMEVHPEIAWQLNKVLAHLYPMAIPAEFRTRPKKQPKAHRLHTELVSFEVIQDLLRGMPYNERGAKHLSWAYKEPPLAPTIEVMERLGGVNTDKQSWYFDYLIQPVLKELSRTGRLPEQKSHQFYPTPKELAQIVIAAACIGDHHTCLEPEAGQGGLADFMPKERTTCIEISELHCQILKAKGYNAIQADFIDWADIEWSKGTRFDRIVMNPPFSDGRAVKHVQMAAQLLADQGILTAIMPASNKGKDIVPGMAHEWGKTFLDMFKDASVDVAILVLKKP